MTEPHDDLEQEMEAYLAGEMAADEKSLFEERMSNDPDLATEVETQQAIENRLRQTFPVAEKSLEEIESWLSDENEGMARTSGLHSSIPKNEANRSVTKQTAKHTIRATWNRRTIGIMAVVTAAAAVLLVMARWARNDSTVEPFFEPRALAQVYRETVDHGFEPYYNCEDDDRFAETFRDRHQVALRLNPTPDGHMIGLSYPGGLSRSTTAMLCYVRGEPVIVFVDRKEFDNPPVATLTEQGLFVHRAELDELVLYEVSPFDTPKMLNALEVQ